LSGFYLCLLAKTTALGFVAAIHLSCHKTALFQHYWCFTSFPGTSRRKPLCFIRLHLPFLTRLKIRNTEKNWIQI